MNTNNYFDCNFNNRNILLPFILTIQSDGCNYYNLLTVTRHRKMASHLVTLMKGQNIGLRNTERNEELIIVISGDGEIEAEGLGRQSVFDGSAVYLPPLTQHDVYNLSDRLLKYFNILSTTGGLYGNIFNFFSEKYFYATES